jgi:hypothetical protein|tara:strand:- start:225 stop:404 length:180 start_codon:yes stop_codon:yes gene_type:complete
MILETALGSAFNNGNAITGFLLYSGNLLSLDTEMRAKNKSKSVAVDKIIKERGIIVYSQ